MPSLASPLTFLHRAILAIRFYISKMRPRGALAAPLTFLSHLRRIRGAEVRKLHKVAKGTGGRPPKKPVVSDYKFSTATEKTASDLGYSFRIRKSGHRWPLVSTVDLFVASAADIDVRNYLFGV